MGYEPDGPREETVYPGQDITVSLKLVIPRRRNKAAVDAFDRGTEFYNKGSAENYKRAAEEFSKALSIDPNYSQAALFLARADRDLFREDEAERYFKRAIEIDPDYMEARATYGGMLLDKGATDESIRQLNAVVQRDPKHATAWYMLAQALRIKELYPDSIDAASKAISLTPNNAEPYFWLAESLRMSGKYQDSIAAYKDYLRLSDFDSKLAGKMNYYVMGFLIGTGKKKRAAQRDVWKDLRSMAFLGLCDSSRRLNRFEQAIPYCQRALTYDSADPYAHYALALSYFRQADATGSVELLPAARKHFRSMLDINADLAEAEYARKNIATIDAFLAAR
jgi:tetratricopeptide (TPR) repeat protein